MSYLALKYIHILSATLLFGTGLGTAFHGLLAFRTKDPRVVAAVGRSVVLADWLFTAPAIVVQPATGVAMALVAGFPLTSGWLGPSPALAGCLSFGCKSSCGVSQRQAWKWASHFPPNISAIFASGSSWVGLRSPLFSRSSI